MLIFGITKLINKTLAPKLLSLGLRLHDISPSSSSSGLIMPLLLPLAQKLVSIEVRDDYRNLARSMMTMMQREDGGGGGRGGGREKQPRGTISSRRRGDDDGSRRRGTREGGGRIPRRRPDDGRRRPRGGRRGREEDGDDDDGDDGEGSSSVESHGERRVRLLGGYVLPALSSSSSSSPPPSSHPKRYPDHFVRWMRGEYLMARYGPAVHEAVALHPELRYREDRRDGEDDAGGVIVVDDLDRLLPSADTVRGAFGMEGWSRRKAPPSSYEDDDGDGDGDAVHADDVEMDIETIVHRRLGGHVKYSGPLNAYFEMRGRDDAYELWTREYVRGLAKYLLGRIEEMDNDNENEKDGNRTARVKTTILDVGAGDGRLAYFLRLAMRDEAAAGGGGGGGAAFPGKKRRRTEEKKKARARDNASDDNGDGGIAAGGGGEVAGGYPAAEKTRRRRRRSAPDYYDLPAIVATDDGSWKAPIYDKRVMKSREDEDENEDEDGDCNRGLGVERLSVIGSLEKYGPRAAAPADAGATSRLIVLCSWMPPGLDWTADFRRPMEGDGGGPRAGATATAGSVADADAERLVEEYILIGEADDGSCGHNWLTWGNPDFRDDDDDRVVVVDDERRRAEDDDDFGDDGVRRGVPESAVPPHVVDGYVREDLEGLSAFQFSRFDCKRSRETKTVSFRRRRRVVGNT